MPLQQTSGNDTQDAYGGGAAAVPVYVENVFSTYLYTGTGTTQTITNGIDLLDNGGLVWIKRRQAVSPASNGDNSLRNSSTGSDNYLVSNLTDAQSNSGTGSFPFNNNGFTLNSFYHSEQDAGVNYVSWTFRKQPKFFDIVTYTGNGTSQNIAHNLGSVPGCIIVKRTDASGNWQVYHSGLTSAAYSIQLNLTNAQSSATTVWNSTAPTSSVFSVGTSTDVNASGSQYIAYIFASNAGGFGLTGTDSVISCGTYVGTALPNIDVSLGWEPQWVMVKSATSSGDWLLTDVMRGQSNTAVKYLTADTSNAEINENAPTVIPTATGFHVTDADTKWNNSGSTYIYIAIRRGPMAVPTDPTKVFAPITASETPATVTGTTNFPVDMLISTYTNSTGNRSAFDRLRGTSSTKSVWLNTNTTAAEATASGAGIGIDSNVSFLDNGFLSGASGTGVYWNFARAPGFFDIVCYKGTGSAATQAHNLGVVPQLIIVKNRGFNGTSWGVYSATLGPTQYLFLNLNNAQQSTYDFWNNTSPTSTVFSLSSTGEYSTNASGQNYVAYLFATLSGVSKVGSYTGTGATQSIACGFGAGGARFILAKRTDSTGDWYCWDSANGLTSSSSPYLLWDTTAAQTTGNNGTYASSGGFTLTSASPVNTSGGSFIFLAIA